MQATEIWLRVDDRLFGLWMARSDVTGVQPAALRSRRGITCKGPEVKIPTLRKRHARVGHPSDFSSCLLRKRCGLGGQRGVQTIEQLCVGDQGLAEDFGLLLGDGPVLLFDGFG
jgi:hypothetical protein